MCSTARFGAPSLAHSRHQREGPSQSELPATVDVSNVHVNGVQYNIVDQGMGPAIMLLHGFTGSVSTWTNLTSVIGERHRVIAIDLLGHGQSEAPADPSRYSMPETIADVFAILDCLEISSLSLLGYSLGGRVALSLAVAAPAQIDRLILESASPGLASSVERSDRLQSDERLAEILDRDGLEAFVDRWEQVPLLSSQRTLAPTVRDRLRRQRLQGNAIGLAGSLRGMGTGMMPPMYDRLPEVTCPTLLVVGDLDQKYRTVGETLALGLPDAKLLVVPGAGHAVHLEQPDLFAGLVSEFLDPNLAERGGVRTEKMS